MAEILTHIAPAAGCRKTRFRNNKTAVAERSNYAVQDALREIGECARNVRMSKKKPRE